MILLFILLGLLIGTLFGFFGMGGTFLVTPILIMLGYPTPVAIGTGMTFVFGTAIIAALKHNNLGQIDYKLGSLMIIGSAIGIHVGKEVVLYLESLGLAKSILSITYIFLLGILGIITLKDSLSKKKRSKKFSKKIQSFNLSPMIKLSNENRISLIILLIIGFITGFLSGFLGVGGGFIRMPILVYVIGVPTAVAIGTDLFEIVFSGGIGSLLYYFEDAVNFPIVFYLLIGSSIGAFFGASATKIVKEKKIKSFFGIMLIGGAIAIALRELSELLNNTLLNKLSLIIILISALLVFISIIYNVIKR
jgi:uncharacterized membrane protein YfcA